MIVEATPLEWLVGAYERLSFDKRSASARDDDSASVARQTKDNIATAAKHGQRIHRHYTDHDSSAYDETNVRDDFEQMLRDLEQGIIDGIVCYNQDRLLRDPFDLERLRRIAKAASKRGRFITVYTPNGSIDLLDDNDLMMARFNAIIAHRSSSDTARRVARWHQEAAQKGQSLGARTFGWNKDKLTLNPRESEAIRKGAAKLLAGVSLADVYRAWNEAGLCTTKGNKWGHAATVGLFRNPRLVGWRYVPGTKLTTRELIRDEHGVPVTGRWEPILDVPTWEALNAMLDAKARTYGFQKGQKSLRKYLLSGLLRCGNPECSMAVLVAHGQGRRAGSPRKGYACPACKRLSIDGPRVEEVIERTFLGRLAASDTRSVADDAPWSGAARLAEINELIEELMTAFRANKKRGSVIFPQVDMLTEERDALTRERGQYEAAKARRPLSEPARILADWDKKSIAEKRVALEASLRGVLIHPPSTKPGQFDPNRIEPLWIEEQEAQPDDLADAA